MGIRINVNILKNFFFKSIKINIQNKIAYRSQIGQFTGHIIKK